MKNRVKSIAAITACVGLCAAVWASQSKSEDAARCQCSVERGRTNRRRCASAGKKSALC